MSERPHPRVGLAARVRHLPLARCACHPPPLGEGLLRPLLLAIDGNDIKSYKILFHFPSVVGMTDNRSPSLVREGGAKRRVSSIPDAQPYNAQTAAQNFCAAVSLGN